ncbi:methionine aminotransferase [Flavihumibacter petaseus]|uniref:Putative aminotransferase n=1 Tax=Flavihumibacter petaseus NBRC 106054 TaxID=1220578 RepID=A0A0E9MXX0_9BACT|nr:methionine aminotransferase [Flavihumibacter petaseus]GAO42281.1 putative aminotransferase [Flavihumibacter petaseus NBRC 106054]
MLSIPSKLPQVGTTVFTTMSALASQYHAINLGQGFPDFPMNGKLVELVTDAMRHNYNQYAPMPGWMPLREVLCEKFESLYGATIHPDSEITITPGGTYALYTALTTILEPGDEVIVLEPAYDSYVPNIIVNGGVPVLVSLNDDFSIPWDRVGAAVSDRTKAIMINSPNNPTGSILSADDIEALRQLIRRQPMFIVSDEVYEHLVFDGKAHHSLLRYPDLMENAFVCFSFGKVYHCTGWKLGYCVAPKALTAAFRKIHQYNCFSCHTPSQVALAGFLKDKDQYLSLGAFFQEKRDFFFKGMEATRFVLKPSFGSYFACATYNRITDLPDAQFAGVLVKDHGVATIPVSAFYQDPSGHHLLRFCFGKKQETLEKAIEKLTRL